MNLLEFTSKYTPIPYKFNGMDKRGWSCYGLFYVIYREELGIELPYFIAEQSNRQSFEFALADENYRKEWVEVEEPGEYDLILFKILGRCCHVGMYIGQNYFIHAWESCGTVTPKITNSKWKNRIDSYWRYIGKK